ncbi:MAG: glycosyltransferase [Treponema sp.]|nr:glycosyltransferase [Treponema sp.]
MSTYNGEKYILEQMESIRLQTISPDEVIICDDCSTDSTPKIIQEYISKHSLTNWCFTINKNNLGWKKNFYNLIDGCKGDLVFLADQDDVWNKRKLELMIPCFNDSKINVLTSKYIEKSKNLNLDYKCNIRKSIRKHNFASTFMWVQYPGCAYCFRKSYFDEMKQWWRDFLPHDAFLYRNAIVDDSLYIINSNLIIHRVHDHNAGNPKSFTQSRDDLNYYFDVLHLLQKRMEEDAAFPENRKNLLSKAELWLLARKEYYISGKTLDFMKLWQFIRFYPHVKSFIKEFFVTKITK